MDDLLMFLCARRAEDAGIVETIRCGGFPAPTWTTEPARAGGWEILHDADDPTPLGYVTRGRREHEHIARHDPARISREIAAWQTIIGGQTSDHAPVESAYGLTCRTCVTWLDDEGAHEFGIACCVATLPSPVVRMLYSSHMAIVATSIRFDSVVDGEIRQFAATMGITYTAALHVLVVEALMARGLHKEAGEGAKDE